MSTTTTIRATSRILSGSRFDSINQAPDQESQLHGFAHEQCFIANSIKSEVVVEIG